MFQAWSEMAQEALELAREAVGLLRDIRAELRRREREKV